MLWVEAAPPLVQPSPAVFVRLFPDTHTPTAFVQVTGWAPPPPPPLEPPPLAAVQASTSVSSLQPSFEALVTTRILLVVIAVKLNFRHTLLLPVTLPPSTVTQLEPFQYCTSNAVTPYKLKVMVSVGSEGL